MEPAGEIPEMPPLEVLDALDRAVEAEAALTRAGRTVRFHPEAPGRVRVEVHDAGGGLLGTVTPSHALAIASGRMLVACPSAT